MGNIAPRWATADRAAVLFGDAPVARNSPGRCAIAIWPPIVG